MQSELPSPSRLPTGPGSRILRAAEAEAWQHGFGFSAAARLEALQVAEQARRDHAAERARGHAEGRAEGAREAAQLIAETTRAVDRYLASLGGEVAGLAMSIVHRVIGEIDAGDLVGRLAARAIADLRREKWLRIRVNPAVLDPVRLALGRAFGDGGCALTVEADPKVAMDGCVITSEFAVIDAGLEAQLAAIAATLGAQPVGAAP